MQKLNFSNYFLTEADNTTHVTTFMRANPPTIGHERVVNHVIDLAKNLDAGHSIVLSHSHDGDKNPLTAEQKLRHARLAFPGANVSTSSSEKPTLMHHVSDLYNKGVRNLHLVVGQDRVGEFNDLLNKYKGVEGRHGLYGNDMNITVHSAGGRDPDAEGVEGVSGTGQRLHARNNNFEGFRAGAPSRMSDEQAASLMNDIRNAKPATKPKPKKLKEETTPTPVIINMLRRKTPSQLEEGEPSLRPAIKVDDGKIWKGKPGQQHHDIYAERGIDIFRPSDPKTGHVKGYPPDGHIAGFIDHRGRFLHRDQAYNYAQKNDMLGPNAPRRRYGYAELHTHALKEETTSAGDAVRGFGDVSGNPAVDEDPLQQYITTNELAKDKENGALMKLMRQSQHNLIGFKEFNPRQKGKK